MPSPQHRRLAALLGTWKTEGRMRGSPSEPSIRISGSDAYEWLPGEFFLVHHVDVYMGDERQQSIELIGYDESSNAYPMHSYDNHGNVTTMQGTVTDDDVWTFANDTMRATLTIAADNRSMTAYWERKDGSQWVPWMDIEFQ